MPSLSQLPDKLKRNKLTKALERLGFNISTKGGKGSHFKATFAANQKSITIPSDLRKDVLAPAPITIGKQKVAKIYQ